MEDANPQQLSLINNEAFQFSSKICLKPDCKSFSRIFMADDSGPIGAEASVHRDCKEWCYSFSELRQMSGISFSADKNEVSDFLRQPVKSVFQVYSLIKNGWQEQLVKIIDSIRQQISVSLDRLLESIFTKITRQAREIEEIYMGIEKLIGSDMPEKWSLKHQKIYKESIQNQMKELSKIGLLRTVNYEAITRRVEIINEEIHRLEWGIWQKQSEFQRKERQLQSIGREELQRWTSTINIDEINKIMMKITGALKLKPFTFNEKDTQTVIQCQRCPLKIASNAGFKQAKRSECLTNLLKHMCYQHQQEILGLCMNQARSNHLLSFEEFIKDISTRNIKRFLIIDRQNIKSENIGSIAEKDLYCIQVVSKGRDNLTAGKYLAAESSGKDAADILIIILLYEIGRIVPKAEVTLLTKDHFGKTLVPILGVLGTRVHTSNRYDVPRVSSKSINQSQQIMIDQQ